MALSLQHLASGTGWCVSDVVCTAGPRDRPFEERHEQMCIALVTRGTFNYRSTQGAAVLAPGSLLLGNSGACFECGHEHSAGDRCLSFHIAPEIFETVAMAVPGQRHCAFTAPRLPLLPDLLPVIASAESLRDSPAAVDEFHELTLSLAGAVCQALAADLRSVRAPNDRDRRRVTAALRRIEADPAQPLSLSELAAGAAMSPFHFLRVFEQVVGVTPAQYILRLRLRRAAVELRNSQESVATIAAECGFSDLSTFNRQFKRLLGAAPRAFRVTASGSRPIPR
ncbi:MAG: helix-turn-helix transcriptional regulator [Proteobacteria bacterium]|nr:helix-turn-helix transcriptional regulator [Pseudomonadota bacterium]